MAMMDEVKLRRYVPADLDAMFAMDVICFAKPFRFDLRSMRRFVEARNAIAVVAERRRRDDSGVAMLGFVIVHVERCPTAHWGYVVTLDVAPEERRVGVAGWLMGEVEVLAAGAGAGTMELHVWVGNEGAIRFYEGRGYGRTGLQRGFYGWAEGGSIDAYVYRKELSAGS